MSGNIASGKHPPCICKPCAFTICKLPCSRQEPISGKSAKAGGNQTSPTAAAVFKIRIRSNVTGSQKLPCPMPRHRAGELYVLSHITGQPAMLCLRGDKSHAENRHGCERRDCNVQSAVACGRVGIRRSGLVGSRRGVDILAVHKIDDLAARFGGGVSIGAEGLAEEVLAEDLVEVVCKLAGADCSRRNGVGDVGDSGVLAGNELGYAFNDRVVLDAAVNGLELVYIDRKGLSAFTGCSFAAAEAVGYLYVLRLGVSENAGGICFLVELTSPKL